MQEAAVEAFRHALRIEHMGMCYYVLQRYEKQLSKDQATMEQLVQSFHSSMSFVEEKIIFMRHFTDRIVFR